MHSAALLMIVLLAAPPAEEDPASLEKRIAEAPGKIGCEATPPAKGDPACQAREEGLSAVVKLYAFDPPRALAALERRFDEIPSPRGGYFPILAAARIKDRRLLPALLEVGEKQRENELGFFASEAARLIETGKCSGLPPPSKLTELCR